MTFQPVDISSILGALAWPFVVVAALYVFRHSAGGLAKLAGERIQRVSFAGFGIEFATMRNVTPATLDVELRRTSGAPPIQSGSGSISQVYHDLLTGEPRGYVVVDLGSDEASQSLSSRLYLLAFLITLVDHSICMVFVETAGGVRRRYVGAASPDDVRWALARRCVWLEPAMAGAYASLAQLTYQPTVDSTGQISQPFGPQIDQVTGHLAEYQASKLMSDFLTNVQAMAQPQNRLNDRDWVRLEGGVVEYAVWIKADRLERRLGAALSRANVIVPLNQTLDDIVPAVLKRQGGFVAELDVERRFEGLLDRHAIVDRFARDHAKQIRSTQYEDAST
jgi:hypothetical protein